MRPWGKCEHAKRCVREATPTGARAYSHVLGVERQLHSLSFGHHRRCANEGQTPLHPRRLCGARDGRKVEVATHPWEAFTQDRQSYYRRRQGRDQVRHQHREKLFQVSTTLRGMQHDQC
jgi:hypothetical protein